MNREPLNRLFCRAIVLAAGLGLLSASLACRKGEAPVASGPAVSREFPNGRCDVTVSGAVQASFSTQGGPPNVASVYWMTDEELRRYFIWKAREETKEQVSEEDIGFYVDQAMSKNPRFTTMLVRCWTDGVTITVVPGMGSRYEDVPFKPGTYKIAPVSRVDEAVPGLFVAQTSAIVGKEVLWFVPNDYGTLDITAFDESRLAGEFSYTAAAGAKVLNVSAKFMFRRPRPAPAATAAAR